MKQIIQAAAFALLLASAPAAASDVDFSVCDGYPVPAGGNDGTLPASQWGLIQVVLPHPEEDGIAACDRALADPALLPAFGVRRGLLLRAKAVFELILDRPGDALVSLDQADAAVGPMPATVFTGQFASANRLLRAYAEYKQGNAAAARVEMDALRKEQPHRWWFVSMASAMQVANDSDWPSVRAAMLGRALVDPAALRQAFWAALYYGDFAEALRLGPQASFSRPHGRDDDQYSGVDMRGFDLINARADLLGGIAYALAATGHADRAAATIATARAEVAPPRNHVGLSRDHARQRDTAMAKGRSNLDLWEAAIALRARAAALTPEALAQAVRDAGLGELPIVLDLVGQLKPDAAAPAVLQDLRASLEKGRAHAIAAAADFRFDQLYVAMPRPGAPEGPALKPGNAEGFYVQEEAGSLYVDVSYTNERATQAGVSDLALLAAATYAESVGKDSFWVDARMLVSRTLQIYHGRVADPVEGDGSQMLLRILPANANALTPAQEPMRWRLIRARDVIAGLTPLYTTPKKH